MLWLWHSLLAMVPIRPLAWEPPYAAGGAKEMAKKKKKKKKKTENDLQTILRENNINKHPDA